MGYSFISYAHSPLDEQALAATTRCLTAFGIPFWLDHLLTLRAGYELNEEIAYRLDNAGCVIVLASSQYFASSYCRAEIVRACELDKRIIRIEVEAVPLPRALLPLASARTVSWHPDSDRAFMLDFARALSEAGIDASRCNATDEVTEALLDHPLAAIIRPSYLELRRKPADWWHERVRRLGVAADLNPGNGYTQLSLALVWHFLEDVGRALQAARAATAMLPRESDAHYAEALALCLAARPAQRSHGDVEAILQRLAIARRQPGYGAHVDLLSALVIANHYGRNFLTPPAEPAALLARGLEPGRRFDWSENARVLETEAVLPGAAGLDLRLVSAYATLPGN